MLSLHRRHPSRSPLANPPPAPARAAAFLFSRWMHSREAEAGWLPGQRLIIVAFYR